MTALSPQRHVETASAVRRFAGGEPVLVGEIDGGGATVAVAGSLIDADRLRRLQELGGDLAVLALHADHVAALGLQELPRSNRQRRGIVPVMSVDAGQGLVDPWSSRGRAHTIRVVSDPDCRPSALVSPGHVQCGLVTGDVDAAPALSLELALAAGAAPAVALSAVVDDEGRRLTFDGALHKPGLAGLAVAPTRALRTRAVARELGADAVECALPTRDGVFSAVAHRPGRGGDTVFALVHGQPASDPDAAVVRTHVACLLGDTFGSLLCDCSERLRRAIADIVAAGNGVIVYMKPTLADPFSCPSDRAVDRAVALDVLRDAGLAVVDEKLATC